jgi:4-amino-4-deoxy-L-arabinose transferase-like glycosyltransferase
MPQRAKTFAYPLRSIHALADRAMLPSLGVLCVVVLLLSTRGISSEGTVSLQGDMPRYLMNGAYFWDLLHDLPITHLVEYTYHYYARYPALSLGHHPLLPGVAEVPFFAVFGVSVFAARLSILCFTLIAVIAWFRLSELIYGRRIAILSALLFATTPFIVEYSRVVMSEIPALAMVVVAAYWLCRYCETLRRRDALFFAVAAAASAYGKYHCVFMLPIFVAYLAIRHGVSSLFSRDALLAGGLTALLVAPLIPMTVEFSRVNLMWVEHAGHVSRVNSANLLYYLNALWEHQVTIPVLLLSATSLGISAFRRDRRVLLFVMWIVGFYVEMTYTAVHDPRFAIYWIPPFCLLAASCLAYAPSRRWTVGVTAGLVLLVAYQFILAARSEPEYADGYEEAAQYVLEHRKGESVLFSGKVDSGFFVFFVRKHDSDKDLVVLRADKILVTSLLGWILREQPKTPQEIHQALHDFGVGYVVIEDTAYTSPTLELLRQELKGNDFVLRKRIPIHTNRRDLRGVDLAIYEHLAYTPAKRDRLLDMQIPLIGGKITLPFGDLLRPKTN